MRYTLVLLRALCVLLAAFISCVGVVCGCFFLYFTCFLLCSMCSCCVVTLSGDHHIFLPPGFPGLNFSTVTRMCDAVERYIRWALDPLNGRFVGWDATGTFLLCNVCLLALLYTWYFFSRTRVMCEESLYTQLCVLVLIALFLHTLGTFIS